MLSIWRNVGNEEVTDETTKGYDKASTHHYEEFSSSVTDEKLSSTANH